MAPLSDFLLPDDHPSIAKWHSDIGKDEKTDGEPGKYRYEVDHMEAFLGQKKTYPPDYGDYGQHVAFLPR
eukprot:3806619-Pyramimonas_sp.AAC.1